MFEYLALLQAEFAVLVFLIATMFGLIIGSFLNVVIYRIPVMMERDYLAQANEMLGNDPGPEPSPFNLIFPNSRCPHCDHAIRPWENIPLLSYALLRGKCSGCKAPISGRYPTIELLTGLLTGGVIVILGATPAGFACCLLTWALIALSMIDYDTQYLPDNISLPLLWLGLVVNYFGLITSLPDAFIGACLGYLSLWSVFWAFKLVTGKDGMGYGDFKLLAALGAWLGWQLLPLIIILSSFAGALIGGVLIVSGRDKSIPIPFGPYLAIAGFIALLWGDIITQGYLQFAAF